MKNLRLIVVVAALLAASNALAVSPVYIYINPDDNASGNASGHCTCEIGNGCAAFN